MPYFLVGTSLCVMIALTPELVPPPTYLCPGSLHGRAGW
jgi:hypothetical protein